MDPNACLREWRELYKQLNSCDGMSQEALNRLGELSESLDEWMSKGGFLPEAWARNTGTPLEGYNLINNC